jgi:O-antigen ligase
MVRNTVLWLVVFGILTYSWKDWYRGLCAVIAMIGVIEHPDVPKQMLGIPGLNPFNLMLGNVVVAWACQRKREGLQFDVPPKVAILLALFAGIVVLGFVRMVKGDVALMMRYYDASFANLVTDYLINSFKFAIPALLLYDGCRTEERFRLAVIAIVAVYVLFALQVAKWMPPTLALDADALERRSLRVLARGMGYHRVNMSAMLSGASWAILALRVLMPRGIRWPLVFMALFVVYAQLMTGGRAGYAACLAVGIAMSFLKWRRYLLALPAALGIVMLVAPGVMGRATEGFTAESHDTSQRVAQAQASGELRRDAENSSVDSYTVTAGRSVAWPFIIDRISQQPWVGYGRQAMLQTGLATYIFENYGEIFPHPHNAYLEQLFDNGILGAAPILSLYFLLLFYSVRMFVFEKSPTCVAIGGMSTAFILSLCVSALGSQSFYPEEGWMCAWCTMFLMLRVRVERQRLAGMAAPVPDEQPVAAVRPGLPMLQPAFATSRFSMPAAVAKPAAMAPRITWQPRSAATAKDTTPSRPSATAPQRNGIGNGSVSGKGNGTGAAPAAPVKAGTPGPLFRRGMPFMPQQGIGTLGIFGSDVTDRLVWERA